MIFIDSHAHFDLCAEGSGSTIESILGDMGDSGLKYAVQISIETSGFSWSYDFSRNNRKKGIMFSLGIHPSSRADANDLVYLSDFVNKVINSPDADLLFGIGETGLDYYRMRQPKDSQMSSFEFQATLAKEMELPLIVHSRDAMEDTFALLDRVSPLKGIMHCFPGDSAAAKRVLDLGFYISFAGNLTYKSAAVIQDAARYVPLDRVLFETDAPFLTPVPHRGKQNRPLYVRYTYEFFAELIKEPVSKIAEQVNRNFISLMQKK
jgi:TatD DNase family protein